MLLLVWIINLKKWVLQKHSMHAVNSSLGFIKSLHHCSSMDLKDTTPSTVPTAWVWLYFQSKRNYWFTTSTLVMYNLTVLRYLEYNLHFYWLPIKKATSCMHQCSNGFTFVMNCDIWFRMCSGLFKCHKMDKQLSAISQANKVGDFKHFF